MTAQQVFLTEKLGQPGYYACLMVQQPNNEASHCDLLGPAAGTPFGQGTFLMGEEDKVLPWLKLLAWSDPKMLATSSQTVIVWVASNGLHQPVTAKNANESSKCSATDVASNQPALLCCQLFSSTTRTETQQRARLEISIRLYRRYSNI